LSISQELDVIKFTHPEYPPYTLTYTSATNWTWARKIFNSGIPPAGADLSSSSDSGKFIRAARVAEVGSDYAGTATLSVSDPTGFGAKLLPTIDSGSIIAADIVEGGQNYTDPTITVSGADGGSGAEFEVVLSETTAEAVYTYSAVIDGKETGIARPEVLASIPDITQARGTVTTNWVPVDGAELYRFYRSRFFPYTEEATIGVELGFIGETRVPQMVDVNITPDYTQTPVIYYNPFVNGQILAVQVTAGGSGYSRDSTITVSDPTGSGAVLYPIVDAQTSEVRGVYVAQGGEGYTSPSISVSDGTGAAFSIVRSPETGNYPAISFTFQKRSGYAGTLNRPLTVWASKVDEPDNFSTPSVLSEDDSYTYRLDLPETAHNLALIRHAVSVQRGLLVFTSVGVMLLASADGEAVTPLSGTLEAQSYIGSTFIPPLFLGEDIAYIRSQNRGIRLLSYNANARKYEGRSLSLRARHLFRQRRVIAFTDTYNSTNQAHGVFSDGTGFTMTLNADEEQIAFAPVVTQGRLEDAARVRVGIEEHVYYLTRRKNMRVIEYTRPFESDDVEDHCILDSRITLPQTFPNATIAFSGTSGLVTITADANVFLPGHVGWMFVGKKGRGVVEEYDSATQIKVRLTRPIDVSPYQTPQELTAAPDEWRLGEIVGLVSGVPYEGSTVSVVVDGKRQNDKTVVDGTVTLDFPGSAVHIGFPFVSRIRTLPPAGAEGHRVNIIGAAVMYNRVGTMTLGVGNSSVYPQPLRTDEAWFDPTRVQSGERFAYLDGSWSKGGHVVLDLDDGLSAEILRMVVWYEEATQDAKQAAPEGGMAGPGLGGAE
jgi:hypothetical protein